jgi:hypothetical protein
MTWTGGCLCGAVRYDAKGEPLWFSHCHCQMCRKHTGAALGTYVGFPKDAVTWTKGEVALYQSSRDVKRGFCPECGSTLTFHRAHETSFAVGSLDRPQDLTPGAPRPRYADCHVWTQNRLPWLRIDDELERFAQFPPDRETELAEVAAAAPGARP